MLTNGIEKGEIVLNQTLPLFWTNQFGHNPYAIMDCVEGMKKLPDNSIDMVITDPPFNVEFGYESYSDDMQEKDFEILLTNAMHELARIVKVGPVIVFFREEVHPMFHAIEGTPLKHFGFLKWLKMNSQHNMNGVKLFRKVGLAFILSKGTLKNHHHDVLAVDFLEYNTLNTVKSEIAIGAHPCPSPYKLYAHIIRAFTNPGDIVLDPFLGSGTTLAACKDIDRIGLGFDISPEYEQVIQKRMNIALTKSLFDMDENPTK
jgi:DNA modification methylase